MGRLTIPVVSDAEWKMQPILLDSDWDSFTQSPGDAIAEVMRGGVRRRDAIHCEYMAELPKELFAQRSRSPSPAPAPDLTPTDDVATGGALDSTGPVGTPSPIALRAGEVFDEGVSVDPTPAPTLMTGPAFRL